MDRRRKRVLAIHDISCFGRCSLTAALPIISASGVECTVMPTAVLSTHTGGFTGFTFRDMTDDMVPIADHWSSLGLGFDAIYTGYLGSARQISVVRDMFERFGKDALKIADPAMADNGEMYPLFDMGFAKEMGTLCADADIIVPNMTEACFMLGRQYEEGPYTEGYVRGIMKDLSAMGPERVVLTGVSVEKGRSGAATYDSSTGRTSFVSRETVPGIYHGTGDVYASALVASLMNGRSLEDSASIAVDFTVGSIIRTHDMGTDVRFGVDFEEGLFDLTKAIRCL
ncbi:MAG: pyridoxamine kinase [Candidatus Methanomethylophilaceae archaeon]